MDGATPAVVAKIHSPPDFGLIRCVVAPGGTSSAPQGDRHVLFLSCCVDREGKVKWKKEAMVQSTGKTEAGKKGYSRHL